MATAEERMRILRMVEEGKISAEQGRRLLEALQEDGRPCAACFSTPEPVRRAGCGCG